MGSLYSDTTSSTCPGPLLLLHQSVQLARSPCSPARRIWLRTGPRSTCSVSSAATVRRSSLQPLSTSTSTNSTVLSATRNSSVRRTVFQREWSCKSFLLRVCLERNLRTSRRSSCLLRKLEKEKTLPRLPWPGKRPHRELTVLPHPSRSEKPWRLLLKILLHCDQLSLIKLFPFLSKK